MKGVGDVFEGEVVVVCVGDGCFFVEFFGVVVFLVVIEL